MGQFNPTSPLIAATRTRDGGAWVLLPQFAVSQGGVTHSAWAIGGTNLITLSFLRFGTLTADCTLTLQISLDGGISFRDFKTYPNAFFNVANGAVAVEQVKGTHARFTLNPGTMTGSNGVNVRPFV